MTEPVAPGALAGLKVLDLTGELGNYCGKLFADLGADVVLVEPPEGIASRRRGPFLGETAGPDRGFAFAYMNAGKRGIVLDLGEAEGRAALARLAARADLLVESFAPGTLERLGFDDAALWAANPALVRTSITPFGQTGPFAHYAADDLTLLALGGLLYLGGYKDDLPVAAYGEQAYQAASLFAAVASMAAIHVAETKGQGDRIDVSAQEAVVMALENAVQFAELEGTVRTRYGGDQRQAGAGVFACRDGHIVLLAGGIGANRFWLRFVEWMADEAVPGSATFAAPEWLDAAFLKTPAAKATFLDIFGRYAMARTKAELYAAGRVRKIPLAPVATPAEILDSPQLAYRGFFVPGSVDGRTVAMPGAPYMLSETPWRMARPAPRLGEHTAAILADPAWGADEPRAARSAAR